MRHGSLTRPTHREAQFSGTTVIQVIEQILGDVPPPVQGSGQAPVRLRPPVRPRPRGDGDRPDRPGRLRRRLAPDRGRRDGIDFEGDADRATALADSLRFNVVTNTGVVPTTLRGGDAYQLTAVVPSLPADLPSAVTVEGSPIVDTQALGFMDAKLDAWSGQQSDPWTKVVAIAKSMRAGAYTDGGPPGNYQNVFLPGHSLARLQRFVRSEQLAGDDEQYAAALALAANRLGIQARVVFGATPDASGEVKGSDIHAWVEVHSADGTWAPILPRDFLPDRNKQPEQQQQRSEEQKTGAQVLPPVANNPPSVLQGPDQAQNATQNRKPPPKNPLDPSNWPDWVKWLLTYVGLPLLVLLLLYAIVRAVKARRRVRRRTRGPAGARIAGGWTEVVDTAADLGIGLPRNATRLEQAVSLDARVGDAYPFVRWPSARTRTCSPRRHRRSMRRAPTGSRSRRPGGSSVGRCPGGGGWSPTSHRAPRGVRAAASRCIGARRCGLAASR